MLIQKIIANIRIFVAYFGKYNEIIIAGSDFLDTQLNPSVVFLLSVLAAAQAGLIAEHGGAYLQAQVPAITSQHQNILRSPGNLGQISTYSKTIDTPFSSVSKHDVRVSNPGIAVHSAPVAYAAPAYSHGYAAPAYAAQAYAAPAYAAPAYASHGYAAPAIAAPAYASHGYAAPVVAAPAYASHGYAAPAYASHGYAAPAIAKVAAAPALIGVAYSAAPAVSHMSYSNGVGLAYNW
ncbi:uncharacterized protein LOC143912365 [Arctopsyche grandis]|uniref:uncharacterized protein LOC143912365 n=1 Tax=Arctopsyche grandis TaxID=121162 RepID=UPI00406D8299